MSERWRRELHRLSGLGPSPDLLGRAREGPRPDIRESRARSRWVAGITATLVAVAGGVVGWRAFGTGGQGTGPGPVASVSEAPPADGYFIQLPAEAEPASQFEVTLTATTNLPEGTRLDISTTDEGSCCPPVEDGRIAISTQNSACYGPVGAAGNSPGFSVTVTARPDIDTFVFPGPMRPGGQSHQMEQPDSVFRVLGENFERLTGDQVVQQDDGSKWLVARAEYDWPEPQCGGDPIPLFGGPECEPDQEQLQAERLESAMEDVMGAISQGRMCEFWSVMVPPDVESAHPWREFAAEWRAWLEQQNFSDSDSGSGWREGPLRWEPACTEPVGNAGCAGGMSVVNVIHDGERIATLDLQPLPDFCPHCGPNVVPFWGVMGWSLF